MSFEETKIIVRKQELIRENPVIKLLEAVLEDARKGGTTTIAMVTVSAGGTIQTPAQGHQVMECALGCLTLLKRLEDTKAAAVRAAEMNPQAPLRPMSTLG